VKRKYISLTLTFGLSLFLYGCWDRVEVNDVAYIMASAIDSASKGNYKISSQFAIPTAVESRQNVLGSEEGKTYLIESAVGKNVFEAEKLMQEKLSRKFFKGHRRVLFIGEEVAKQGIKEIIDSFSRDPTSRLRTYLLVVKGGKGIDMLKISTYFERIPGDAIIKLQEAKLRTSVTFKDFFLKTVNKEVPVMGVVELTKPEPEDSNQKLKKDKRFKLSSTAVFRNYKLVGYLHDPDSLVLLWMDGELKRGIISEFVDKGKGNVGVVLRHNNRKIDTYVNGDKVKIHVDLEGEGTIYENNSTFQLNKPSDVQQIEISLEKSVASKVKKIIQDTQHRLKADVYGFGHEISQDHPREWKKLKHHWEAEFPQAEIQVTVHLHIVRTGMTSISLTNE
jgi:spore germination protein KC